MARIEDVVVQAIGCVWRVERVADFFEEASGEITRGQTSRLGFDLVLAHAFSLFSGAGASRSSQETILTTGL